MQNKPIYYYKNSHLDYIRTAKSLLRFYVAQKVVEKKEAFWQAVDAA